MPKLPYYRLVINPTLRHLSFKNLWSKLAEVKNRRHLNLQSEPVYTLGSRKDAFKI